MRVIEDLFAASIVTVLLRRAGYFLSNTMSSRMSDMMLMIVSVSFIPIASCFVVTAACDGQRDRMPRAAACHQLAILIVSGNKKRTDSQHQSRMQGMIDLVPTEVDEEHQRRGRAEHDEHPLAAMLEKARHDCRQTDSQHDGRDHLVADTMGEAMDACEGKGDAYSRKYDAVEQADYWSSYGHKIRNSAQIHARRSLSAHI